MKSPVLISLWPAGFVQEESDEEEAGVEANGEADDDDDEEDDDDEDDEEVRVYHISTYDGVIF